jgi:hypothetical protein
LFSPAHRGIAMAGYAMAVVGGPALGESILIPPTQLCISD